MYFPIITNDEKLLPLYVKGIGSQKPQEPILRKAEFQDYQWIYCSKGSGRLIIGEKEYIISAGQGYYLTPYLPHQYYSLTKEWHTHWIIYHGSAINLLYHKLELGSYGVFNEPEGFTFFTKIYDALSENNLHKIVDTGALLYQLIIRQKNTIEYSDGTQTISLKDKLNPVILYMNEHLHEDISLSALAGTIEVTGSHLCKLFKKGFGLTPVGYLTQLRIMKAKELLLTKQSLLIQDIAKAVGFIDTSYFCKTFRDMTAMTPASFRKYHGK